MKNIELITNVLNKYVYCFRDEKIYTKAYFATVISKLYAEAGKNKDFVLVLGDLDKISKINTEHGYKAGDLAIKNTLNILIKNMPKDMVLSRIGGDEFVGIIENAKLEDINNNLITTKQALAKKDNVLKAQITLSALDSKEYDNLSDMLIEADKQVLQQKNIRKKKEHLTKEEIKENIKENVLNFYDCLRMGEKNLIDYKKMYIYKKHIKETYKEILFSSKRNVPEIVNTKNIEKNKNNDGGLTYEEAELMQKHLNSKDVVKNIYLEDKDSAKEIFKKLFYKLLYNTNTNQLSKLYYETVLERKINSQMKQHNYNIVYIHSTGLKIANTLIGHEEADLKLETLGNDIEDVFNKAQNNNFTFFNKRPLYFDDKSAYLLDMNAGNFLMAIPENRMSEEELENTMNNLRDKYENNVLQLAYSIQNTKNYNNINQVLGEAKLQCELKKADKFNNVDVSIMNQLIEKYLRDSVEYFKNDEEKFKDTAIQEFFIDKFLETFEDVYLDKYIGSDIDKHTTKDERESR